MTNIHATATRSLVSGPNPAPTFACISGAQGENALQERAKQMLEPVRPPTGGTASLIR
jgi:hypothetical protein